MEQNSSNMYKNRGFEWDDVLEMDYSPRQGISDKPNSGLIKGSRSKEAKEDREKENKLAIYKYKT